ncbi:MAG: DUF547 domain-containing protein [Saprospiraceae bacterium]|nr:DUF547 domain-containing protein [Saprospiraceae bacterium]
MYRRNLLIFLLIGYALSIQSQSIETLYDRWISPHIVEGLFNYESAHQDRDSILSIKGSIASANVTSYGQDEVKSFYINAYNALVIIKVLEAYPVRSVQDMTRFFTSTENIGGMPMTLDQLEKIWLAPDQDPRLHMVLVCGALSCPPLPPASIKAENINEQLDELTRNALNNPAILNIREDKVSLSQIFNWYTFDFGNEIEWINSFVPGKIPTGASTEYKDYNWALNDINNTASIIGSDQDIRYFTSYLYGPGQYELSMFNNYFTELRGENFRSNFFTSFLRYTHGYSKKVNFAVDIKWRSVSFGDSDRISMFDALSHGNEGQTVIDDREVSFRKFGVSAIIPRVKYQPINTRPNLSIQHSIAIPTNYGTDGGFLDWGSPSIYNDVFYDITVNSKSSIFLQASVWLENIGGALFRQSDGYYQFSTPLTFIYQYFPSRKTTLYALVNAAPQWGYSVSDGGSDVTVVNDAYQQLGLGIKQYITEETQLELLYTKFFTARANSSAATFNVGVRYFGW